MRIAPALGVDPKLPAPVCCCRIRSAPNVAGACGETLQHEQVFPYLRRSLTPCAVTEDQCATIAGQALRVAEEMLMG